MFYFLFKIYNVEFFVFLYIVCFIVFIGNVSIWIVVFFILLEGRLYRGRYFFIFV